MIYQVLSSIKISNLPKRRIERTDAEEEEFQQLRKEKRNNNQRRRRAEARNVVHRNNTIASYGNTSVVPHASTSVPNGEYRLRPRIIDLPSTYTISIICDIRCQRSTHQSQGSQLQSDPAERRNISEHYIGAMDVLCSNCKAKHFAQERVANKLSFNDCCSHGEVSIETLPNPPTFLKKLLNGTHEESKHFFDRIRCCNNSFSFASFNANLVNFNNRRSGPYCFKIHGQIYYQINTSLYPNADENPSYGQLFIVDQNEAIQFRCEQSSELKLEIMEALDTFFRENNVFAQSYQMMNEELKNQQRSLNSDIEPETSLLFTLKPGLDRNRYNFQRTNEVAAVFSTTADGEIPESYITIRNINTKTLQFVSTMDPNVEPWIYPLFYPYGTRGWHSEIPCVKRNRRVTRAAYIKFRMAIRDDFNIFLLGRRLFQQWIVDSYVKVEKDRIQYCKNNQTRLRAESYQGLIDHLQKRADTMSSQVGKIVILPSTFTGSPRNMLQLYQDAMAIVRKYGKPDLFITMTCNPKWREIQENLLAGQCPSDRPDIVARVFNIKKDYLVDLIVKKNFFGVPAAYVYVIEFQKRGLPHMHLLVTLKHNFKITTAEVVNKYISAEIPDQTENINLHNIVMKQMIHGPCGSWCLVNGKCSKNYPKNFKEETTLDENGYPYYRRRETGIKYSRQDEYVVDNSNVVPHNPVLLELLNCHINVEVVSSIKSVKYLYKYIYKGHDAAAIVVSGTTDDQPIEHDEIRNYIETRYVGPVEACWRILSKPLHDKSHSIMRLPIHLQNQQNVTINDEVDDDDAIRIALQKQTMLMDYFSLNARDEQARQYVYSEIPTHYVFKKEKDTNIYHWVSRKAQFNVIGRIYSVSPTQTELFHLRLLLLNIKGATSFDKLRTVNEVVHDTYVATCLALGLIDDDDEWKRAMHEAEVWMMPIQLRRLFVRILIHCQPVHPEELWEEFKDGLSQDFARNFGVLEANRKAYIQINTMLMTEGSSLDMFPSMQQISEIETDDDDILPQQHKEIGEQQYASLNDKQKEIVDIVMNAVMNDDKSRNCNNCFYIDGPGGSGKTFIYTTICHLLKSKGKRVCTMAFTGIAATLLPQGKTVHKTFGMPVPLFDNSTSNIKAQSKESEYIKNIDIFIWDEGPMAPKYALELIDRTLRDLMNTNVLFGGKIIILGGDFRQLLPIKIRATRSEMVNLSMKFSTLWKSFFKFTLTQNMRTLTEEAELAKFVLDIGDGRLNDENNNVMIPEICIAPANSDFVEDIYGSLVREKQYEQIAKSAILSARNVDVEEINKRVVQLFDCTSERIYTSVDSIENCDNGDINEVLSPEYLNTLNPANLPPHQLRLSSNCIVMLIRNLSINEGLCNGTRLQILELGNHLLRCQILTGDKAGQIVFVNRITLYCEDNYPFTFKRRQFPIKLAFAMTINKSQGQTFNKIGIDLRKNVFNHGQLYVAFSRVRSWSSLKIYLGNQRNDNNVKNFVYTELYDTVNN